MINTLLLEACKRGLYALKHQQGILDGVCFPVTFRLMEEAIAKAEGNKTSDEFVVVRKALTERGVGFVEIVDNEEPVKVKKGKK